MVRKKSVATADLESRITHAITGVQRGEYKSLYAAAKVLGLTLSTLTRRVNGGLSRSQARQQQQKLSYAQENVLLKWIKQLTISGYSLGH
jgi:hypothetical protein